MTNEMKVENQTALRARQAKGEVRCALCLTELTVDEQDLLRLGVCRACAEFAVEETILSLDSATKRYTDLIDNLRV